MLFTPAIVSVIMVLFTSTFMAAKRTKQHFIFFSIGLLTLLVIAVVFVLVGSLVIQQMPKIHASPQAEADPAPVNGVPDASYTNNVQPLQASSSHRTVRSAASTHSSTAGQPGASGAGGTGHPDNLPDQASAVQTQASDLTGLPH
jgi:hypothetical protein